MILETISKFVIWGFFFGEKCVLNFFLGFFKLKGTFCARLSIYRAVFLKLFGPRHTKPNQKFRDTPTSLKGNILTV
jgi:hypothetical protein